MAPACLAGGSPPPRFSGPHNKDLEWPVLIVHVAQGVQPKMSRYCLVGIAQGEPVGLSAGLHIPCGGVQASLRGVWPTVESVDVVRYLIEQFFGTNRAHWLGDCPAGEVVRGYPCPWFGPGGHPAAAQLAA
jgi:hypothetical protein